MHEVEIVPLNAPLDGPAIATLGAPTAAPVGGGRFGGGRCFRRGNRFVDVLPAPNGSGHSGHGNGGLSARAEATSAEARTIPTVATAQTAPTVASMVVEAMAAIANSADEQGIAAEVGVQVAVVHSGRNEPVEDCSEQTMSF